MCVCVCVCEIEKENLENQIDMFRQRFGVVRKQRIYFQNVPELKLLLVNFTASQPLLDYLMPKSFLLAII